MSKFRHSSLITPTMSSMVFILPKEGEFSDFESSMTVDDLDAIIDNLTSANGTIEIPRFTFESGYQLKEPLSDMGMTSILPAQISAR